MSDTHEEHHTNYVKIWGILLVLLAASVAGPEAAKLLPSAEDGSNSTLQVILILTTAFGIAVVSSDLQSKGGATTRAASRYDTSKAGPTSLKAIPGRKKMLLMVVPSAIANTPSSDISFLRVSDLGAAIRFFQ